MYLDFCFFTHPLPLTKNKALISCCMFVSKLLKYSKLPAYMVFGFLLAAWKSMQVTCHQWWHNIMDLQWSSSLQGVCSLICQSCRAGYQGCARHRTQWYKSVCHFHIKDSPSMVKKIG